MVLFLVVMSRRRSRLRAVLALRGAAAFVVVIASSGRAGAADPTPEQRASELAEQGRALFESGHAEQALQLVEEAYRLAPQPILLYNMARGYEQLGDLAHARDAYQRFLVAQPDRPERPAIEQRMATLQRLMDERVSLERDYDQRLRDLGARQREILARAVARPRGPAVPVGAAIAALGGVGAVAGVILWSFAASRRSTALAASTDGIATNQAQADAVSFARDGNVVFGVGAGLGATGALLIALGSREKRVDLGDKSFAIAPTFGPGYLALKASF